MSKPKLIIKQPNENGKIELTQEELEVIVDDAYEEGYADGYLEKKSHKPLETPSSLDKSKLLEAQEPTP